MKKLTETFLFNVLDEGNGLTEQFRAVTAAENALPLGQLDYQFDIIRRRFNYPIKERIFQEIQNGGIVPVFNREAIGLPVYIPVVGTTKGGRMTMYANLTPHGKPSRETKELEIDSRKLFALLQTAYFTKGIYSIPWNKFAMNSTILKDGSIAYSKLVNKVLDKMYGINMNKLLGDATRFVAAKFFLVGIMGRDDGPAMDSIAYLSCIGGTTRDTVSNQESKGGEGRYKDVNSMAISLTLLDGLKGLTMRSFLENWMRMYGEAAAFALEYFPFFLHAVFSSVVSAHIVNDFIIDPLTGQEGVSLYNESSRLLR